MEFTNEELEFMTRYVRGKILSEQTRSNSIYAPPKYVNLLNKLEQESISRGEDEQSRTVRMQARRRLRLRQLPVDNQ